MSNLNPGGSRSAAPRAFTAREVARACDRGKRAEADGGGGSIAGQDHQHSREVQRRLRQQERKAKP